MSKENLINQNTFPVQYQQTVAWGDMDAFGHVNNVMYYRYIESARILYFDLVELFKHDVQVVVVHSSCQYLSPVFYPDILNIGVSVKEMKNTSMRMEYELISQQQNKVVAKAEAIIVFINAQTMEKTTIPELIRSGIEHLENHKMD